jgi:hypothetical protein
MQPGSEFEIIYAEALHSATARHIEDPDVRTAHDSFVKQAADTMTEAWTTGDTALASQALGSARSIENLLLTHPSQSEFDEEDIRTIARVRFLGRLILDTAVEQLRANPTFNAGVPQTSADLYTSFQYLNWYENHPGFVDSIEKSHDPEVASPLRLRTWPRGEYINCLGISIALAAASEIHGLPYVYGNEIRTEDDVLTDRHHTLMHQIRRYMPYFDDASTERTLREVIHLRRDPNELYDDILHKTPDVLLPQLGVRDFHHFIINEAPNDDYGEYWIQVDPFALVYDGIKLGREAAFEPFFEHGHENAVVLSDEYPIIDKFFRRFHSSLDIAKAGADRIRFRYAAEAAYKSGNFMDYIEQDICDVTVKALTELYGGTFEDEFGEEQTESDRQLARNLLYFTVIACGADVPELIRIRDEALKNARPTTFDADAVVDRMKECLAKLIRHDPALRAEVINRFADIPMLAVAHLYAVNLQENVQIRERGGTNTVVEIADPEFMIGAMYMNHYATWRKDGRINVARHLSRICSSQLLWQAARQDETAGDDRIAAMGEVIQGLKPRQLHPLVLVASSIPIPAR